MNLFLYLVTYFSALVFLIACLARAFQYARTPLHLRWELYPVPHEEPKRAEHGGSYFESLNWWSKPSHGNLAGDLKFMIPEILFLKSLREFNRKMWLRSFPFHFGLYLLITTGVLLFLGSLLSIFAPVVMAGSIGSGLNGLYTVTGTLGLALGILGALGLLIRRRTDPRLKVSTTPGDIFNLLFFIVTFGILAAGYYSRPASTPDMLTLSRALLTFDTGVEINALLAIGLFLTVILVAYIPMTHMSHFIAKYFTYHAVRWDDSPNRRGGKIEKRLAECLAFRPTWAAAHIKADGRRTWAEIASINPAQEEKK